MGDWGSSNDDWGSSKGDGDSANKDQGKSKDAWGSSSKNDDWGSSKNDEAASNGGSWGSSRGNGRGGFRGGRGGGGFRGRGRGRGGGNFGGGSDGPRDNWGSSGGGAKDSWGSSGGGEEGSKGGWGSSGGGGAKDGWSSSGGGGAKDSWGSSGGGEEGSKGGWGSSGGGGAKDGWSSSGGGGAKDGWSSSGGGGAKDGWSSSGGGGAKDGRSSSGGGGAKNGWSSSDAAPKNDWGGSSGNDKSSTGDNWGSSGTGQGEAKDSWGSGNNDRGKFNRQGDDDEDPSRKRFKQEDGSAPAPYKPEELDLDEEVRLQGDGAGENFQRYNDQKVTCIPKDITPVEKFEDIVASKLLLKNIESQRYSEMTPIQKWAMPAIMEGHDLIGCAQTGSGKTAAFLLPVLQTLLNSDLEPNDPNSDCQNPYCLIISPTRELANQIHIHANMLSKDSIIKCHVIYGQVSTHHLKAKLSTGCHMLVATVGRLKDFVQRGWIGFKNIKYIILDEGDRLVDEGFSSEIRNFFNHETMPPKDKRQTLFFSATFKDETQLNAREYLKDSFIFLTVGKVGAANVDIKQEFLRVNRQEKKRELKTLLADVPETEKTIIFTQTKIAADMLAGYFTALNLSSTSIHGDRHQSQREQAIRAFKKGEKRFLISSPVGNRGLDLPKVSLVINYDLPPSIDEYVHRIGRTGRAGHVGRALSFYDEERDRELLPSLIHILTEAKQEIPDWMTGDSAESAPVSASGGADDWGAGASNKPANDDWNSPAKDKGLETSTDSKPAPASKRADDGWNSNADDW